MKKFQLLTMVLALLLALTGCTQQEVVRYHGGTMTIDLPGGEKLVNVTWKNDSLWTLTRPIREGEVLETHTFQESSALGLMEGKVFLVEQEHGAKGGIRRPAGQPVSGIDRRAR